MTLIRMGKDTAKGNVLGWMAPGTMGNGRTTRDTDKVSSQEQMATTIMENGTTVSSTAMVTRKTRKEIQALSSSKTAQSMVEAHFNLQVGSHLKIAYGLKDLEFQKLLTISQSIRTGSSAKWLVWLFFTQSYLVF